VQSKQSTFVLHIHASFSMQSTKYDSGLNKNSSNRQLFYIPQNTYKVLTASILQLDRLKLALRLQLSIK